MNTTLIMDENDLTTEGSPGAILAAARLDKGLSAEYIAGKLNLRVKMIELLELDDYKTLPDPVFIKGYLRGYAKLLGLNPEPLLKTFNELYKIERPSEKALWQSRRVTNRGEFAIKWFTGFFALVVLIAVSMWWYTNKENELLFSASVKHEDASINKTENKTETEIRLTDLSKMRSLISKPNQLDSAEE